MSLRNTGIGKRLIENFSGLGEAFGLEPRTPEKERSTTGKTFYIKSTSFPIK